MRIGFALTLLIVVLVDCARAQTPDEAEAPDAANGAAEPVVIADGRSMEPPAVAIDAVDWLARPGVQQAVAAARAHWQGQDPSYEEEVRVLGVAEGAFTEPGAEQQAVLYLMSLWPRCCPKVGIAVVEGDRLVRNLAFESTVYDIRSVADLDGDGLDELVELSEFGMGGQFTSSFNLISLVPGGVTVWGGEMTNDNSCAAMQPGATAARVTALPGPELTIERYSMATCEATEWEPVGAPEPMVLDPQPATTYVDLPAG
jgi:hypothetical protein